MHILCLGLSHHLAPVELRERLNYSPASLKAALARFGCGREARPAGVSELAILSTCNRLELYAAAPAAEAPAGEPAPDQLAFAFASLMNFVAETRAIALDEVSGRLYRMSGIAAIEHLGRVAAGLDSMILGEPQILGQVAEAYALASAQGAAGPVLSALFRAAIHTGKRARTETAISRDPATTSSVAIRLAEQVVGPLSARQVLVVGAGAMAELAVEALRVRGAADITVVNRTHARAALLAERWGARALAFEQLGEALAAADIVLASTDAPHFVITTEMARAALAARPARPLVCIDIAVPRDIDPDVRQLPGVHCYDIDDLEAHLNGALAHRRQEIPRVEAIVAAEMQGFAAWLRSLDVAPVIADLRAKAEAIRRAELDKTLRRLPHLSADERWHIETLTEALVNKLLHDPTRFLKSEAGNGHGAQYTAAVRDLFVLHD